MKKERSPTKLKVTYTEGYEQRFTEAILKIYETYLRKYDSKSQNTG